jgi:hypothetical protein
MDYQFTTGPIKPYKICVAQTTFVEGFTAELQDYGNPLRVFYVSDVVEKGNPARLAGPTFG